MSVLPLRIGFVVLHTSPLDEPGTKDAGGMNVVVLAQARELARRGHQVELITRRSAAEQPASLQLAEGLRLHHLDAGPQRLLDKGAHETLMPAFTAALAALLGRLPLDLLHAEHWFSGIAALPVARRFGIPLAQSFHSIAAGSDTPLASGERAESPGRLVGEQTLARDADLVIAVSEAEAATVRQRLGGERVAVVPLGVDAADFHPLGAGERAAHLQRRRAGEPAEVLVAGRLHPLKGFDLAIDAVAAISSRERPVLRIVGAPPPDDDGYTARLHAAAECLNGAVRFDGALHRDELADRLRHADLVLVPSHSETFGLIALEAAASGVPVIAAADAGGLREAVLDGETGLLIEGRDPATWAAAIREVLSDEAGWIRMGESARAFAERRSWSASTDRLLVAYAGILPRR
ncbi:MULTISPECIES: glycosyltransferase [unclassified Leucobacter]|uniref:glycosyltransferase n=1 Tax=unclassified Leucobacter TaxID=2621730 RepID=UPI00165D7196|nr:MULTISPECIES: glycosyltransferase [unclassified Leucobacter]MBC9927029.1 glycosyltransferase [Leucobacter sp. cx-169]